MKRAMVGVMVVALAGSSLASSFETASGQVGGPLQDLDFLTRTEWTGGGDGFRTTLRYRWALPGRVLRASNEVVDGSGRTIARYEGAYGWDAGRDEISVWIASEAGEVHQGRAWLEGGVLWHEMEVSGGAIGAYASAIREDDDGLRYYAAYGTPSADASLLATEPIVYRAAGPDPGTGDGSSPSPELIRIDGEVEIAPPGATRVRFTGLGHGQEWAARVGYFRDATPGVLERLRTYVEGGAHR